ESHDTSPASAFIASVSYISKNVFEREYRRGEAGQAAWGGEAMIGCRVSGVRFLLSALLVSAALFGQRADRAIITGVVVDPNGSHVAGSAVTIWNESTGVETQLVTNDAGDYTSPPLV